MKAVAVAKCQERLRRARAAIAGMTSAKDSVNFSECWESYLVAIKAIGEILREGAKASPVSEAFVRARWPEVSSDPLLRYLMEARNVEEHGLEPTAEFNRGSLRIGGPGEDISISGRIGPGGTLYVTPMNGSSVTITRTPQETRLLPVTDRKGELWPVPESHLGEAVGSPTPLLVSDLGLTYFTNLVAAASKLT